MEKIWKNVALSVLISLMLSLVWHLRRKTNNNVGSKLPPGPKGWPVIGNIFDLGILPHRSLASLKHEYGPVVWLKLGSVKTMAILSSGAAEELFKHHNLPFNDRNVVDTMKSHDMHKSSIPLGSYSSYWRTLRRICAVELFTKKKINETKSIRRKCVDDMLLWIEKEVKVCGSSGIEMIRFVFPVIFNTIGNLVLSRDLADPHSKFTNEFYSVMTSFIKCLGIPNVSDLFPSLRWLDLQGLRRRNDCNLEKVLDITSGYVKERIEQRQQNKGRSLDSDMDFLDMLLDFKGTGKDEPASFSQHQISILPVDIFLAETETSSTSIEWAMSELLNNPEVMAKIKAELARVVGANKKLEESDIDNLPYLQATVEETLRLHPPLPLLIPRKAVRETNFMGYTIPKDTNVLVNAWAIGRDEEKWEHALSFKPERFLDSRIGYMGQDFDFIPFGAGRRICPGIPLAQRMLPLVLGSLLHHFEWELCENDSRQMSLDMTEKMGLTVGLIKHLKAVPKQTIKI